VSSRASRSSLAFQIRSELYTFCTLCKNTIGLLEAMVSEVSGSLLLECKLAISGFDLLVLD
jgi:hypothetical protein